MERIPFGQAEITVVKHPDGSRTITCRMADDTFTDSILNTASKRGLSVVETIGEGYRS